MKTKNYLLSILIAISLLPLTLFAKTCKTTFQNNSTNIGWSLEIIPDNKNLPITRLAVKPQQKTTVDLGANPAGTIHLTNTGGGSSASLNYSPTTDGCPYLTINYAGAPGVEFPFILNSPKDGDLIIK